MKKAYVLYYPQFWLCRFFLPTAGRRKNKTTLIGSNAAVYGKQLLLNKLYNRPVCRCYGEQ